VQYKVPQNIDLEDKIVGPFTMKQFLYLMIGGAICYGWWNYANTFISPSPMAIFLPLGLPVGLLAFCLALIKVNDRPFEIFILNIFKFLFSPKQRKWTEGYKPEPVITLDKATSDASKNQPKKDIRDLDELAKGLEQKNVELAAQTAPVSPKASGEKPKAISLAINDVQSAAEKQHSAQSSAPVAATTPAPSITNQTPQSQTKAATKKGGLFGLFK